MNHVIYERLLQAAKGGQFVSYDDLSAAMAGALPESSGLNPLNLLLEEISDHELANGRPLLPAIIVNASTNMPGGGLFSYAKRKGLMKHKGDDNLTFFLSEAKKVHNFWTNQPT